MKWSAPAALLPSAAVTRAPAARLPGPLSRKLPGNRVLNFLEGELVVAYRTAETSCSKWRRSCGRYLLAGKFGRTTAGNRRDERQAKLPVRLSAFSLRPRQRTVGRWVNDAV